ncbi:hypothetical protein [Streptomyces sp. WAC08241]|uniref:hypothetical protein n=1 Tax=Streptomyces sp. WAC08241 TaxID=2487421 RepID=UPI000F77BE15|nr:hypothetical protein [Streptomyces sp. WAC08241]RSS32117.1 hypothetical protein EF906_34505 [Streptomyces sp. WAC08241]
MCGQRTLDDDFPLTHAAVGGWLIWLGAALVTAGAVAWAVARPSHALQWARAGALLAPGGDIVRVDRGVLPPAVDCVFTDGTASLVLPEVAGLWCALAVSLISCAALARGVVSAGPAAR